MDGLIPADRCAHRDLLDIAHSIARAHCYDCGTLVETADLSALTRREFDVGRFYETEDEWNWELADARQLGWEGGNDEGYDHGADDEREWWRETVRRIIMASEDVDGTSDDWWIGRLERVLDERL